MQYLLYFIKEENESEDRGGWKTNVCFGDVSRCVMLDSNSNVLKKQ